MGTLPRGEIAPVQEGAQKLRDFRLPRELGGLLLGELSSHQDVGLSTLLGWLWDPGIWDPGIWDLTWKQPSWEWWCLHGELERSRVSSGIWLRAGHGEVEQSQIMALQGFFFSCRWSINVPLQLILKNLLWKRRRESLVLQEPCQEDKR